MMMLRDLFPDLAGGLDIDVSGISSDSRTVGRGEVFAALKGVRSDGRGFIDDAIEKGAIAVLTDDRPGQWDVPALKSSEPRRDLALAAASLIPDQPSTIAAVTGTNGKSSVVTFLRQIWTGCGHRSACLGTLGVVGYDGNVVAGTMTTPDPVGLHRDLSALAQAGVSHCAMEASSHGLDQYRLDGVKLAGGAFTNLSRDHLDYHADMESYLAAKMRLFSDLLPRGVPAVVGADDPMSARVEAIAVEAGLELFSVGWRGRDLQLSELTPRRFGQDMLVCHNGRDRMIAFGLVGAFQAVNALAAAAIALALGEDPDTVLEAIGGLAGVPGRMEYVGRSANGGCVYVDFAHTPAGLETLLRAVRSHTPGRIVVVFGCGGDRDRDKRVQMGRVAQLWSDRVIVTDDNPRSESPADIRAMVMRGCPQATAIGDRAEAVASGIAVLESGDTLVIAGKGHEAEQIVGDTVIPFSDREVARRILVSGGGDV